MWAVGGAVGDAVGDAVGGEEVGRAAFWSSAVSCAGGDMRGIGGRPAGVVVRRRFRGGALVAFWGVGVPIPCLCDA